MRTEADIPAHYGSPFTEQRDLINGNAIVDLSHHGIVTVSGADRLTWLDSMTSQQLSTLKADESSESLLLSPQGHIEFVLRALDDGERTWLLVDDAVAEPLTEFLNRMRFALRVEVANVSDDFATVGFFFGGAVESFLQQHADDVSAIWRDPWHEPVFGGWQYASTSEHPAADWRYGEAVLAPEGLDRLRESLQSGSLSASGHLALEALRIHAWRPSQHAEVDDRALPHEFDWLRSAVHLNKGCYRGQETVAKVHNLGHPPRRLTLLHLDGSDALLPAHGDLVYVAGEEKPVGRITSAGRHFEWGALALALLKRSVNTDATLEVQCEDARIAATQEVIVPPEAGATRSVPRLPRL